MNISVYLNFKGTSKAVLDFYQKVFDTEKPYIMLYKEMPGAETFPMTEETKELVMHSSIYFDGFGLMISDVTDEIPFVIGNNVTLTATFDTEEEVRMRFERMKVGAEIEMEPQTTFFSKCYSLLTDQFGIRWQLMQDMAPD